MDPITKRMPEQRPANVTATQAAEIVKQPAEIRPAIPSVKFVWQIAQLPPSANYNVYVQEATKAGFPVYVERNDMSTRVRVGPFTSREEAQAAAPKLMMHGINPGRFVEVH